MKLVVGLGNPGTRYQRTKHNLGYMVIDELARRHHIDITQEKFHAWFWTGELGGEAVALAKPTTFMNRSGQAVTAIGRFYRLQYKDLLVVTDDLALPAGKLRIRERGSPGGHNGLADVGERLGSDDWARVRIGIGEAAYDATSHVLGRIPEDQAELMARTVRRAADAVLCWIQHGITKAMNTYNPDPKNADRNADGSREENT